jgi:hypothetical protein
MAGGLKTANFTVRATMAQSVAWKRAAEGEGFHSVGAWLAGAADAYLKVRARAGMPIPLAWHRGRFRVRLEGGELVEVKGHVAPPFGSFCGTEEGPCYSGRKRHVLVYTPSARVLATLRSYAQCKALGAELARLWVRWGGKEPAEDPAPLVQRFQREEA